MHTEKIFLRQQQKKNNYTTITKVIHSMSHEL